MLYTEVSAYKEEMKNADDYHDARDPEPENAGTHESRDCFLLCKPGKEATQPTNHFKIFRHGCYSG